MPKEQDSSKIDETSLQYHDLKIEYDHMTTKLENEKNRRVYYQDIVYAVCISIERALGMHDKIVVGTIDEPSTETQEKIEELSKLKFMQEAEINDLRACIKCEKMPEGFDVNDDATTELAVELAKSQLETSCMVEDVVHKADLLREAEREIEECREMFDKVGDWLERVDWPYDDGPTNEDLNFIHEQSVLLRHHKN